MKNKKRPYEFGIKLVIITFLILFSFSVASATQITSMWLPVRVRDAGTFLGISGESITVEIYDTSTPTCVGSPIYTETFGSATNSFGLATLHLGETASLSLDYNADYYICVDVGSTTFIYNQKFRGGQGQVSEEDVNFTDLTIGNNLTVTNNITAINLALSGNLTLQDNQRIVFGNAGDYYIEAKSDRLNFVGADEFYFNGIGSSYFDGSINLKNLENGGKLRFQDGVSGLYSRFFGFNNTSNTFQMNDSLELLNGNLTADYFFGDGSQLTGIVSIMNWSDPVNASIIPDTNNTYDLGSNTSMFKDGYFAGKLTVLGDIDPINIYLSGLLDWNGSTLTYNSTNSRFEFNDNLYTAGNLNLDDNNWIYLDTAKTNGIRYATSSSRLQINHPLEFTGAGSSLYISAGNEIDLGNSVIWERTSPARLEIVTTNLNKDIYLSPHGTGKVEITNNLTVDKNVITTGEFILNSEQSLYLNGSGGAVGIAHSVIGGDEIQLFGADTLIQSDLKLWTGNLYFDDAKTYSLIWSSGNNRFEFNNDLFSNNLYLDNGTESYVFLGDTSADDGIIRANTIDPFPYIKLNGASFIEIVSQTNNPIRLYEGTSETFNIQRTNAYHNFDTLTGTAMKWLWDSPTTTTGDTVALEVDANTNLIAGANLSTTAFKLNITAPNGTTGTSLLIDGYNKTSNIFSVDYLGNLIAGGTITTNGSDLTASYGELWNINEATGNTITIVTSGTYYQWTNSTAGDEKGSPYVVANTTSDALEVGSSGNGTYEVHASVSFRGTASSSVKGFIFKNGVRQTDMGFSKTLGSSASQVGSASISGFIDLVDGDSIDLRFTSDGNGNTVIIHAINLDMHRID